MFLILVFTFEKTLNQNTLKSLLYVSILFCAISIGNAQSKDDKAVIPDGWNKSGQITFLFNQSAFNKEWQGGGLSSYAGNLSVNYNFNYKKADLVWDNKIMGVYGLTKINGAPRAVKSDDRLEFTSLVGKKVNDFWYYSGFLNFQSQFDSGFNTLGIRTSHAFSPAYLQAGPGILWKKSNNLFVNIAPATARIIYVDRQFTEFGSSFGVGQGKTISFELGASVAAYYKTNLMDEINS